MRSGTMPHRIYWGYMLKCSDDSYYVGMTENLAIRLAQHEAGVDSKGYTHSRRPVELVRSQEFSTHDEAFQREHQLKGWSRTKKEALIRGDWDGIHEIVKQEREKRKDKKNEAS